MMLSWFRVLTLSTLIALALSASEAALWKAIAGGDHVVLMRHALAPGTGDPASFSLDDRSTQRNLSEAGEAQAKRIGERFRQAGISQASVYTSQWARCRETAQLLNLGPVEDQPSLNSFFRRPAERGPRLSALRAWLTEHPLEGPVVLVTHQVTITGLTDIFPASGEMIVVRRAGDQLQVIGRIPTDP
jgi:phosphohistidine phosphatase SixA